MVGGKFPPVTTAPALNSKCQPTQVMPGLLGEISSIDVKGTGRHPGYPTTPLHSGSRFVGHQQSKGSKYQVEVVFKVRTGVQRFLGRACKQG